MRLDIGFVDAYKGLRAAGLSDEAIAGIMGKAFEKLRGLCLKGGLPAGAGALLAGGKTAAPKPPGNTADQGHVPRPGSH